MVGWVEMMTEERTVLSAANIASRDTYAYSDCEDDLARLHHFPCLPMFPQNQMEKYRVLLMYELYLLIYHLLSS